MGDVDGLFFAHEDEIDEAIGQEVYFGEILGKHSEIHGTLEEKDIERLDIDGLTLQPLYDICGTTISGYNPLSYISCNNCDSDVELCECRKYG